MLIYTFKLDNVKRVNFTSLDSLVRFNTRGVYTWHDTKGLFRWTPSELHHWSLPDIKLWEKLDYKLYSSKNPIFAWSGHYCWLYDLFKINQTTYWHVLAECDMVRLHREIINTLDHTKFGQKQILSIFASKAQNQVTSYSTQ